MAETVRGGPTDAPVNRLLKAVGRVDVADEAIGRTAGQLLGSAVSAATVDAIVVATANRGGAVPSSSRTTPVTSAPSLPATRR